MIYKLDIKDPTKTPIETLTPARRVVADLATWPTQPCPKPGPAAVEQARQRIAKRRPSRA